MFDFIKTLLLPSGLSSVLILMGLCVLAVRGVRRLAVAAVMSGAVVYVVFASGVVSSALIGPLERYDKTSPANDVLPTPDTAVVLTAYASADTSWPLSSRPGASTLYRIVEAVNLYKRFGLERLVISGGPTSSRVIAELLEELGVPKSAIVVDRTADHTSDSGRELRKLLAEEPFFLVTSAGHMPRATLVFEAQGMHPLPVATDYQMPASPFFSNVLPSAYNLYVSDLAVREYAALLWYRLTGRIDRIW